MSSWTVVVLMALAVAFFTARNFMGQDRVDGEQARALIASGASLVDVRSLAEYRSGHIEGAIHLPIDQVTTLASEKLPSSEEVIVVYCRSGARSSRAKKHLESLGYTNVYDLGPRSNW